MRKILRYFGQMTFLRIEIRNKIIRFFYDPYKIDSEVFTVNFFGNKYKGDLSTFIDWSVYFFYAYSIEELHLMRDALKGVKDPIVVDVGANLGNHSLYASTIAEQVYSFEPYQKVLTNLYDKIRLNNIKNIKVYPVGLGKEDTDLAYTEPDTNNTGTGTFAKSSTKDGMLALPVRHGDKFFEKEKIGEIHFLKMDIEGYEYEALAGLEKTIEKSRPVIFVEWSANNRGLDVNLLDIIPHKYVVFKFNCDRPFLYFFNQPKYLLVEERENFVDGNKVLVPEEQLGNFIKRIA